MQNNTDGYNTQSKLEEKENKGQKVHITNDLSLDKNISRRHFLGIILKGVVIGGALMTLSPFSFAAYCCTTKDGNNCSDEEQNNCDNDNLCSGAGSNSCSDQYTGNVCRPEAQNRCTGNNSNYCNDESNNNCGGTVGNNTCNAISPSSAVLRKGFNRIKALR
jgi:hypothetical protein